MPCVAPPPVQTFQATGPDAVPVVAVPAEQNEPLSVHTFQADLANEPATQDVPVAIPKPEMPKVNKIWYFSSLFPRAMLVMFSLPCLA